MVTMVGRQRASSDGMRFTGTTVIITGAAGGLGSAMAAGLAAAGGRVAIVDLPGSPGTQVADQINSSAAPGTVAVITGSVWLYRQRPDDLRRSCLPSRIMRPLFTLAARLPSGLSRSVATVAVKRRERQRGRARAAGRDAQGAAPGTAEMGRPGRRRRCRGLLGVGGVGITPEEAADPRREPCRAARGAADRGVDEPGGGAAPCRLRGTKEQGQSRG
jgi:NAD(P)-dependent dehydrogenase (short-subunit alcohol dehydrogenase family)